MDEIELRKTLIETQDKLFGIMKERSDMHIRITQQRKEIFALENKNKKIDEAYLKLRREEFIPRERLDWRYTEEKDDDKSLLFVCNMLHPTLTFSISIGDTADTIYLRVYSFSHLVYQRTFTGESSKPVDDAKFDAQNIYSNMLNKIDCNRKATYK